MVIRTFAKFPSKACSATDSRVNGKNIGNRREGRRIKGRGRRIKGKSIKGKRTRIKTQNYTRCKGNK